MENKLSELFNLLNVRKSKIAIKLINLKKKTSKKG